MHVERKKTVPGFSSRKGSSGESRQQVEGYRVLREDQFKKSEAMFFGLCLLVARAVVLEGVDSSPLRGGR